MRGWRAARSYGNRIGVYRSKHYTGWRKCHTENYWAWVAVAFDDGGLRQAKQGRVIERIHGDAVEPLLLIPEWMPTPEAIHHVGKRLADELGDVTVRWGAIVLFEGPGEEIHLGVGLLPVLALMDEKKDDDEE